MLWLIVGAVLLATTSSAAAAAEPALATRVEEAIARASSWLANFEGELRFDAAVMVSQIRIHQDNDDLRRAFERARERADHDHDHPHRRFWMPEFRSPPEHTSQWSVPGADERRVNTNRVLSEALHCVENGWRPAVEAYICGPMRDEGGYQTTHGIWALDMTRRNGCITEAGCLASLRDELAAAQPAVLDPKSTLEIDLYAERVLMLLRTGTSAAEARSWIESLLDRQEPKGSWGIGDDPDPYYRYHATAMTTWAFAEWQAAAAERN